MQKNGIQIAVLSLVLMGMASCREKAVGTASNPVPFEEQLAVLRGLGISENSGVKLSDLRRWQDAAFEKEPFRLLYATLGMKLERKPFTPLSDQVWHFDTEAIESSGDYVAILKNLARISNGEVAFSHVKDHVDLDEGRAWLRFKLFGITYSLDIKVNNQRFDAEVLYRIVQLLEGKTLGRYTYLDTGKKSLVIGWLAPGQLEEIRDATGLNIVWLQ